MSQRHTERWVVGGRRGLGMLQLMEGVVESALESLDGGLERSRHPVQAKALHSTQHLELGLANGFLGRDRPGCGELGLKPSRTARVGVLGLGVGAALPPRDAAVLLVVFLFLRRQGLHGGPKLVDEVRLAVLELQHLQPAMGMGSACGLVTCSQAAPLFFEFGLHRGPELPLRHQCRLLLGFHLVGDVFLGLCGGAVDRIENLLLHFLSPGASHRCPKGQHGSGRGQQSRLDPRHRWNFGCRAINGRPG